MLFSLYPPLQHDTSFDFSHHTWPSNHVAKSRNREIEKSRKASAPRDQMCKILTQSHSCGHSITLKREPCFLVKNKFQCTNEEKTPLRSSRHLCQRCRKLQRKIQLSGAIPSPTKRQINRPALIKRQSNPPSPGEASQKPPAPKLTQSDPSRIIADLKALCAKVAAEQRSGVTPQPDSIRHDSAKVEIQALKASIVSTSKQVRAHREVSGPGESPYSVHRGRHVKSDLFSEFLNEMDPYTSGSNLKQQNHRSHELRQPWTRDSSDRAASFEGKGGILRSSQFPLVSSSRSAKGQGKAPLRISTPSDTRTDSNPAKRYANPAGSRVERHSSKVSTASVRAAKKHINEVLAREFEQTAGLFEIVLQSPEARPLRQGPSGEYDPCQSCLTVVKRS